MSETEISLEQLETLLREALDDIKAEDVVFLDVRGRTPMTDLIVVASGRSTRHVASVADSVADDLREQGIRPMGIEGEPGSEWILLDLGDAVLHVMTPEARDFYRLERLWSVDEHVAPGAPDEERVQGGNH